MTTDTAPELIAPADQHEPPRRYPAPAMPDQLSADDRARLGKAARAGCPLEAHGDFGALPTRQDPIAVLEQQGASRITELLPIRHGRMAASAFAFYRGGAAIMAADLASTPTSGLRVQLCGDAHLSNFGVFASPERHLVFDINDFDETLPGPFEWDVKRLAASFAVVGRDLQIGRKQRSRIVHAAVAGYREGMREMARRRFVDVFYAHVNVERWAAELPEIPDGGRRLRKNIAKARANDSLRALSKLTVTVDGRPRFASQPPLLVPMHELIDIDADTLDAELRAVVETYRGTLLPDRRRLLGEYRLVEVARKVVGVGSVGTRAWVLLMLGSRDDDPLFLQAKEAQQSVLEPYCGRSEFTNSGERVVTGQRMMQMVTDVFLGWVHTEARGLVQRDYYLRQLRDQKFSIDVLSMDPARLEIYADLCGRTLARAHARSGDRIAIASYMGSKSAFDDAVAQFAETYADQTERDHQALVAAIAAGRLTADTEW